ncbi:MAG: 30S ribosomal protein S8 [Candidatus Aenigmatarchaeota archaeon]
MRHDILSDVFCTIKNSESIGKRECTVPASNMVKAVLGIMKQHKYIGDSTFIDNGRGGIFKVKLLGRINNCNAVRPRFSATKGEFTKFEKRYLPAADVGILIVSTSKGVMDQKRAEKENTGGKLLGFVY